MTSTAGRNPLHQGCGMTLGKLWNRLNRLIKTGGWSRKQETDN